jgi:hypothetical protein
MRRPQALCSDIFWGLGHAVNVVTRAGKSGAFPDPPDRTMSALLKNFVNAPYFG